MDEASKRFWWRAAGVALLAAVCAAAFSAYLNPNMALAFGDLMAYCASLLR